MRREVKAVKVRPFLKRTAFFLAAAAGSVMLLFVHGVSPAYGAQGSAAAEETEAIFRYCSAPSLSPDW